MIFEKATWSKSIIDPETLDTSIVKINIRCVEVEKRSVQTTVADGSEKREVALTIKTDTPSAANMQADDNVHYGGYDYSVVDIQKRRNGRGLNSFDYIINLK